MYILTSVSKYCLKGKLLYMFFPLFSTTGMLKHTSCQLQGQRKRIYKNIKKVTWIIKNVKKSA